MTLRNAYATLADFQNYFTSRGQTPSTGVADDAVIEKLLEGASRYLDEQTRSQFYPVIATRLFDVPRGARLYMDRDLLEILSLTNGDGSAVTAGSYHLVPNNDYPKFAIDLRANAGLFWSFTSAGDPQQAISLAAIWGYHDRYPVEGWQAGSTLAEVLDTSELGFDLASGSPFSAGKIIRVENEICIIGSVSTNTLTVLARGDNGSTAATHALGATVYYWSPMERARDSVLEITNRAYQRRFGRNLGGIERVTAAGVVIAPQDVPPLASAFIQAVGRKVL